LNENTINYQHIFAKHHKLQVVAGFSFERNTFERLGGSGQNFPYPSTYFRYMSAASIPSDVVGTFSNWALNS